MHPVSARSMRDPICQTTIAGVCRQPERYAAPAQRSAPIGKVVCFAVTNWDSGVLGGVDMGGGRLEAYGAELVGPQAQSDPDPGVGSSEFLTAGPADYACGRHPRRDSFQADRIRLVFRPNPSHGPSKVCII
jgi:hypothetical protein